MSVCGLCGARLVGNMGHACFSPTSVPVRVTTRHDLMADRVTELRAWARSRIAWCERAEQASGHVAATHCPSTERRTLEAVLRILDGKETPRV